MNNESKLYKFMRYALLILSSLIVIIPILTVVFMSFKTGAEVKNSGYLTLPNSFTNFYNYKYAFQVGELGKSFLTTMLIMVISLTIILTLTSMVAFVLHRFDFKLKKVIILLFTLTMFIPVVTTQVVVYQIIYRLGLMNTIWSVILIYSGVGIVDIYILFNVLDSIPKDLDEAAIIDGANYYQIFLKIIVPLTRPALATIAVIRGIGIYNDFYVPNLYMLTGPKTLTVALYRFYSGLSVPFEVVSAAVIIALIPVIIMFLALQKYIYNGLGGAVKS